MLIQPGILKQICPSLKEDHAIKLEGYINDICPEYGINTAGILHEFLANIIEESGEFSRYEENLNYSTAERIHEIWPNRFTTIEVARPFIHNPKALAEKVYGMRKDLGNVINGDGYAFRGSGAIQLTGRNAFNLFAGHMAVQFDLRKNIYDWAEDLRTNEEWAIHSACWYFAIARKLIQLAIDDNMKEIVRRINGAYTNMGTRLKYYERCKALIP